MISVKEFEELEKILNLIVVSDSPDKVKKAVIDVIDVAEKIAWAAGYNSGYKKGYEAGKSGK